MSIRVIIIEDEPAIARNIAFGLQQLPEQIQLLATLDSVQSSVAWLGQGNNACDLILMDIQLADGKAFDIFNQVVVEPPVIFITAYDQYAIEAFKANGIDYILKPFEQEDLEQAIAKLLKLRTSPPPPYSKIY